MLDKSRLPGAPRSYTIIAKPLAPNDPITRWFYKKWENFPTSALSRLEHTIDAYENSDDNEIVVMATGAYYGIDGTQYYSGLTLGDLKFLLKQLTKE